MTHQTTHLNRHRKNYFYIFLILGKKEEINSSNVENVDIFCVTNFQEVMSHQRTDLNRHPKNYFYIFLILGKKEIHSPNVENVDIPCELKISIPIDPT
jgi:hypothetical protein